MFELPLRDPLLDRLRTLAIAPLADVLDRMGHRECVMDPALRPVSGTGIVGRAFTVQSMALGSDDGATDVAIEAVDSVPADSIVVIATGGSTAAASWGELLSMRAMALGCLGVVSDGVIRDITGIRRLGFPAYARGFNARDARGRLTAIGFDMPVLCGGVQVRPGDYVAGDEDGVIVIPVRLVEAVIAEAESHCQTEHIVRGQLGSGTSARQAFDEHNVL